MTAKKTWIYIIVTALAVVVLGTAIFLLVDKPRQVNYTIHAYYLHEDPAQDQLTTATLQGTYYRDGFTLRGDRYKGKVQIENISFTCDGSLLECDFKFQKHPDKPCCVGGFWYLTPGSSGPQTLGSGLIYTHNQTGQTALYINDTDDTTKDVRIVLGVDSREAAIEVLKHLEIDGLR